jgi:hypothetical protein
MPRIDRSPISGLAANADTDLEATELSTSVVGMLSSSCFNA